MTSVEQERSEGDFLTAGSLAAAGLTDVGLKRETNQDAFGCFPEDGVFIVADGLGGHAHGEVASKIAVEEIGAELRSRPTAPWPEALRDAIEGANLEIARDGSGRATTVVVLVIDGEWAYWAHAGDSRLYRLRGGELMLLTADHTDHGRRYRGQSDIPIGLPHTNMMSSALGFASMRLALGKASVSPGDRYLLCTDGLSGEVHPDDISEILAAAGDVPEIADQLVAQALDAGGNDNVTVVVVEIPA